MNELEQQYSNYIESVCNEYGIPDAIKPLQEGFAKLEAMGHRDRTTSNNWSGKTIRDQNNYDRKFRWADEADAKPIRTMKETSRRYGFTKDGVKAMGMSGKFGDRTKLHDDERHTTDDNSGISKTGRKEMKRKENEFLDREMDDALFDMMFDETLSSPTYEPMSKTQLKGVDPSVFDSPEGNTFGDFDPEETMRTSVDEAKNDLRGPWRRTYTLILDKMDYLRDLIRKLYRSNYEVDPEQSGTRPAPEMYDTVRDARALLNEWDNMDAGKENPEILSDFLLKLTKMNHELERINFNPRGYGIKPRESSEDKNNRLFGDDEKTEGELASEREILMDTEPITI